MSCENIVGTCSLQYGESPIASPVSMMNSYSALTLPSPGPYHYYYGEASLRRTPLLALLTSGAVTGAYRQTGQVKSTNPHGSASKPGSGSKAAEWVLTAAGDGGDEDGIFEGPSDGLASPDCRLGGSPPLIL